MLTTVDKACEILHKTNDGDDLDPVHLHLLESAVNDLLSDEGKADFEKLYQDTLKGYVKPWLHGVENLTIDNVGYVYWKGIQVEHYNLGWHRSEEAKTAAEEVGRRCRLLEAQGKTVSSRSVIWTWEEEPKVEAQAAPGHC